MVNLSDKKSRNSLENRDFNSFLFRLEKLLFGKNKVELCRPRGKSDEHLTVRVLLLNVNSQIYDRFCIAFNNRLFSKAL